MSTTRSFPLRIIFICSFVLIAGFGVIESPLLQSIVQFKDAGKDFPGEDINLRKWDTPAVADLDRDGYPDLILNDHGFGIRISWNNKGKFSKFYDLIMGDIHGVSVGDFDRDSNLEIVLSRGGGSGSNARNSKIFRVDKQRNFTPLPDFNEPLALMRGRTVKWMDGDNDGDLDLLNFAFPNIVKAGESECYVYQNDGRAQLTLSTTLPSVQRNGQKTLITDINGDGIFDLLLYGDGKVKVYRGDGDLNYTDVTENVLPAPIETVTGIVAFDYDNDGDFDLYFSRGQEFEVGETFFDGESKTLGFFTKRGEFNFDNIRAGDVLNLENYHTQWPQTNQLFIGETGYDYEHPGETHSGKDLRLVNSDALGFPDKFQKKGIYIGYVGNQNWRIAGQIWGPLSCVVHGVKTYPNYDHPKGLPDLLLENKNGKFVDVASNARLNFEEHTTGVAVADLDNNGWQDLVITKRGDLIHPNESLVYLNHGKQGFEQSTSHQIISTELGAIGLGVETFDYNLDGKVDVIVGNERGKWHLFKNTTEEPDNKHFLIVQVGNSPSGKATALGALVYLENENGKQIQQVGQTGANYSLSFNPFLHFGLGEGGKTLKVTVKWTNGEVSEQVIKERNKKVFIGK